MKKMFLFQSKRFQFSWPVGCLRSDSFGTKIDDIFVLMVQHRKRKEFGLGNINLEKEHYIWPSIPIHYHM